MPASQSEQAAQLERNRALLPELGQSARVHRLMSRRAHFEREFPRLKGTQFTIAGPATRQYNYIAWALSDSTVNYWPVRSINNYWPRRLPLELSVSNFSRLIVMHGFSECATDTHEDGWEKVALFAIGD